MAGQEISSKEACSKRDREVNKKVSFCSLIEIDRFMF